MPTPEQEGTVDSPVTKQTIAASVIREIATVECPVYIIGASTGGGSGGGSTGGSGKGDPVEPYDPDA